MPCRCSQCFGLAEYMLDVTGKDYGLPRVAGHAPALVDPDPCDGSMTCSCKNCSEERRRRIVRPIRQPKQPWETAA